MRQEEIERLLQAETVSGDELGRVILENDIRRYRQQLGITDESDSAPAGPAAVS